MLRTQASPNPKAQYESYVSGDVYGSNDEPYPSDIYGSDWIYGSNQGAKCSSWNGKACGAGETANVGRGPGSCNSNNDCPCCAPFCSKYGYCQNYQ